jgi:hypothetical protein
MSRGDEPGLHRSARLYSPPFRRLTCGAMAPYPYVPVEPKRRWTESKPPIGEETSLPVQPANASEALRLVLVEDSEDDARLILHELRRGGYHVTAYELAVNSYVRKPVDFLEFVEAARQLGVYWLILNEQLRAHGL